MKTGYLLSLMALIVFFCVYTNAYAEPKKRITVLSFYSDNIDESYANAARTKIEVELVKRGLHVIEQRNIKKVLNERGNDLPCKDAQCAARKGKMVSADYVVLGEIIFADKYMITTSIVDVNDGRIIFADSSASEEKDDILMSVRHAAKLSNYMGIKAAKPVQTKPVDIIGSIDITGGYVMPIAYLRQKSKNGYSIMASAGSSLNDFFVGMETGFIQLFGEKTKPYAYIVPIMAAFRYDLSIKKFFLGLSLSAGFSIDHINESKKTSVQAIVNPGVALGYKTKKLRIYSLAEYFCIAESKRGIQFFNFGLGASIYF